MRIYPYDLQTHSTFSDGDFNPEEIFFRAKKLKMSGLIITDHNTIAHLDACTAAAKKFNLTTIEGIEISTTSSEYDVHILGYAKSFKRSILHDGLKKTIKGSHNRLKIITRKLNNLGFNIDFNYLKSTKGKLGVVFKYDLIKQVSTLGKMSIREATQIMERGGSAYVPYDKEMLMSPGQAVRLITKAGGLPFIAHPADHIRSKKTPREMRILIKSLIKRLVLCGLVGIEIRSSHYGNKEVEFLRTIKDEYKLIESGGSDWHGELFKPDIKFASAGLTEKEFKIFIQNVIK